MFKSLKIGSEKEDNKETKKALETPTLVCSETFETSAPGNGGIEVPLVVNQNPFLSCLGQVIRKNLCFLYQDEEVKQIFIPVPFVSFCRVRTLRSQLVRAKVYPVGERLAGSRKCNKNLCQICKNVIETDTFQTFVDKKVYKLNNRLACSDKFLVYLLSCKVCSMQHKDQTNDEFRRRWNIYKDNNLKSLSVENQKQACFFAPSQTAGQSGFINDTEIKFIDKADSSDPWTKFFKTRYPQGLTNIDPYYQLLSLHIYKLIHGKDLFLFFYTEFIF